MRLGKRLYSLMIFLGVSILGGGLLAGLVIPAVSMAANTGRDAAQSLESLPADFETAPAAERTRIELADGSLLTYFYDENRVVEKLDKIAPIMQWAQVAIEDHRFFDHGAIDLIGTMRALLSTSQGVTQGGSSITQQYARLLLMQTADATNDTAARRAATETTLARKIREMRFAMALEKDLSKEAILEGYLNLSYYGDGAYGVAAAARHYFNVSAKDLNLAQAAMLAGLVRNPNVNPVKFPPEAISRRNDVIDRMLQLSKDPESGLFGLITDEEAEAAKAEPFDASKVTQAKLNCANAKYPFVCDYARHVLLKQDSPLGATEAERKDRLERGGLTIRLTVDPKIQKKSEDTIAKFIDARDPAISVITLMQPATGNIIAMAQSRPKWGDDLKKGTTNFNYAASYAMGGTEGFQGGSTFKIFVAAAALEQGMGAYGTFKADRHMELGGRQFRSCEGPFTQPDWPVTGGAGGRSINMFQGVTGSVNTYFAQLIQAAGVCESVTMATRLGLELGRPSAEYKDIMAYDHSPSFTLGSAEVTPLSLVGAYATFANRGKRCPPNIIEYVKTRNGTEVELPKADCEQVVPREVADAINKIFQGPMTGGTARPAKIPGVQMAGKTGTVDGNKAVWTIGYTPELAGGAVVSYDSSPEWASYWNPKKKNINGAYMAHAKRTIQALSGYQAGGLLLKPAFSYAIDHIEGFKGTKFKEPSADMLQGEQVSVPSCSGLSVKKCLSKLEDAGFPAYAVKVNSDAAKGTLVGTQPSGKAPKGSGIAVQVSKGPKEGSEAWCKLSGNEGLPECAKYLPPPTCGEGEVLHPDPPPGICLPVEESQGRGGGEGGRGRP